ncbi:MAG: hypothetical protein NZZ41_01220 [Candidatus Dojkabacteria bacterium]|nr:hypothetical protein [Candidatus Dojkabacteria bacterium]
MNSISTIKKYHFKNNDKKTYEEIASLYNTTPSKIHGIIVKAFNKIVDEFYEKHNISMFEIVLFLSKFFDISEKEAFNNLNKKNKKRIKEEVLEKNLHMLKLKKNFNPENIPNEGEINYE